MKPKLSKEALEIAKNCAHRVWQKYDDTYGYRTEKQTRNSGVSTDNPENIWFFLGQFDLHNQAEMYVEALRYPESPAKKELLKFIEGHLKETGTMINKFLKKNEKKVDKSKN